MKPIYMALLIFVGSCSQIPPKKEPITNLPEPVTNNAVAGIFQAEEVELFSFNGLSKGKTWKDVHSKGFHYKNGFWKSIEMPKEAKKVLASTAVTVGDVVYMIGGYTVAEDHSEVSVPEIWSLNTKSMKWSLETNMPTPVDDTVALVYQSRYLYLVSGWFDKDNVDLVQVYDLKDKIWSVATPFPAPAVFGHSGGILDNQMLICDGVKVVVHKDNPREFQPSPICLKGVINEYNPLKIIWTEVQHHSGVALYRMAATADLESKIVFAGGSDNPYNFNGIGYNKIPSDAEPKVFSFDLHNSTWHKNNVEIEANMDHRSLLFDGEYFYIVGGMLKSQIVTDKVIKFKYE